MDNDYFPSECRGCYSNCFVCTRTRNGARIVQIRELAACRKLKLQAIARLQRDVAKIDKQLKEIG